jgi:hypothetical protein
MQGRTCRNCHVDVDEDVDGEGGRVETEQAEEVAPTNLHLGKLATRDMCDGRRCFGKPQWIDSLNSAYLERSR